MFESVIAVLGQAGGAAPPAEPGAQPSFILPLVVIVLLFYFMIIRPNRRQQQQVQDMRSSIKKGDKVKSIGGIHGTVASVDTSRNIVTVIVDKNVKLDFDRDAISTVLKDKDEAPAAVSEPVKSEEKAAK